VCRRSLEIAALAACLGWLAPAAALAQAARSIEVDVMVCRISQDPGPVDPRASRLDAQLRGEFRYESLKVLQQKRLSLALNELGRLGLPNGSELQLRPLSLSDRGVLMAVAVQGSVQSDMQIPNGHLVAIGAGQLEGGKLVISLEPHF
jgi:hypothetical protein